MEKELKSSWDASQRTALIDPVRSRRMSWMKCLLFLVCLKLAVSTRKLPSTIRSPLRRFATVVRRGLLTGWFDFSGVEFPAILDLQIRKKDDKSNMEGYLGLQKGTSKIGRQPGHGAAWTRELPCLRKSAGR